jgi:hypothetical protein
MGTSGGASDGIIITLPDGIIENTYTDASKCKAYLALALFDATTIDADIASQSINARDKIDTFLGRSVCFTPTELAETQFAGIVDSASQMTACLVEQNPQAAAMSITEDTITDCAEAYKTLKNWALKNGVEIPETIKESHIQEEIIYISNDPNAVI